VIATDPKGRFERDERADETVIRAAYGHSVDVDMDATDGAVPDTLYHGTAPRNLDAILSEGLQTNGPPAGSPLGKRRRRPGGG